MAVTAVRTIRIGRAPDNDVVLDYPTVSTNHARIVQDGAGRLTIEDLGSTNGTCLNQAGARIQRAEIRPDDHVFFGSFKIPVSRLLDAKGLVLGNASQEQLRFTGQQMVLGRDPSADYPLPFPMISWRHARLERTAQGIEVVDLGSKNGTFVDGVRISGRVTLKPGSEIGLGSFRLRLLDEAGTFGKRTYQGNVTISASEIVVEIKRGSTRRRLLDPVSVTIFPSELVALMGPAGAGKTTLLKALNGYTMPDAGQVLFNGEDLYANQEQFRMQVGYVPQDDILHSELTVREALYYTAKLRTDLHDDEIEARIKKVLTDLNIDDIGNRLIGSPERKVISGGQRKRVNIAMELLSDPSVLFLDEPTSGLSSYDAHQVVKLLRQLADGGKTIVCTIHQPSVDIFKEFDSLMMVARDKGDNAGLLVYFGPAYPQSIDFFSVRGSQSSQGAPSPESLMKGVAGRSASEWADTYRRSAIKSEFIDGRAGRVVAASQPAAARRRREFGIGQVMTLARRNLLLKLRDQTQTVILLGQAPLFAVLVSIVYYGLADQQFTDPEEWTRFHGKVSSVHFLMVVAAVWFGCNNAARDIVGETTIFLRERMVNLRLPSYVLAKILVLALLCIVQCTTLLGIVYAVCDLSGPFLGLLAVLITASLAGTALGLLISAVAPTTEAAIAFLPVVLLPFILLGGGMKPVHEMPSMARMIASITPTRWAYEANLLQEAGRRNSTFTNEMKQQANDLEQKLSVCQSGLTACQAGRAGGRPPAQAQGASTTVPTETDIAQVAFPTEKGRTGLARSYQLLATFFAVFVLLILSTLGTKVQR
jgi:ABC-type multidrug transport system ATPase subunit/pSer/pThr/pTyr-binding forkhead associated (FHA) protein/ABC-type multidrug transport system permease subunit